MDLVIFLDVAIFVDDLANGRMQTILFSAFSVGAIAGNQAQHPTRELLLPVSKFAVFALSLTNNRSQRFFQRYFGS
jgi:uncharacterized membrane protein